ncbi:MAG: AzlD domain-containing protein [Caldilineaceae bacterium]|nr:AzlD domain-containing protein [Caldilineaceae bacterium]
MTLWLTLIAAGLLTYAIRASFLVSAGRFHLSHTARRALRFVPVAVLTALIVPDLLIQNNQIAITLDNQRLIAGLVAVLVAWRTRNTLLTIAVGMAVLGGMMILM